MKIVLVRHTTTGITPGICYGQTDVPLADTFPTEAAASCAAIPRYSYDAVYCSPLTRCRKLAEYCGYPTPRLDDRIKELNFGDWEMKYYKRIDDPLIIEWFNSFVDNPMPGGESFKIMFKRVASFFDELKAMNLKNVLVFAHGGVLACAQVYAGKMNFRQAFEHLTPYGGLIEIEI